MKSQKGSTLVELLLVIVVIGSLVYLLTSLPNAMYLLNKSKYLSLAKEIASKQIQDKRNISYANLINDTSAISDTRIALLPGGKGGLVIEDCDPLICTHNEQIKKITVNVTWKDNNKNQSVSLSTFIGEGGIGQ